MLRTTERVTESCRCMPYWAFEARTSEVPFTFKDAMKRKLEKASRRLQQRIFRNDSRVEK
jgi:hypothetical protein